MSQPRQVNPIGGSGAEEDRDSACTPEWVAKLIGYVELDPATNERSHIYSGLHLLLSVGDNGIDDPATPGSFRIGKSPTQSRADESYIVFCNPPYARGEVIKWVRHYRHTRFIFLLRWDPRTKWFREIIPHCTHVWFPLETKDHPGRIEFEPPPGVTFSSNPFPHALYLREPSADLLARLAPHGLLLPVDKGFLAAYLAGYGEDDTAKVIRRAVVSANAGGGGKSRGGKGKPGSSRGGVPAASVFNRHLCSAGPTQIPDCRRCGSTNGQCEGGCDCEWCI